MENILKFEEVIGEMARERGLPAVSEIAADIKTRCGNVYFDIVSFCVGGKQVVSIGYLDDFEGLKKRLARKLDGFVI